MGFHPSSSPVSDALRLLEELQHQMIKGAVQPEILIRLRQAVVSTEAQRAEAQQQAAELTASQQAAQADASAARAESATIRAEAENAVRALAESEQRYRYMGETIPFGAPCSRSSTIC